MLLKRLSVMGLAVSSLFLTACSSTPDEEEVIKDLPAIELYQTARARIENGSFQSALTHLQTLMARYPFGPHADQVQLDMIYVSYALSDAEQAKAAADRFIRLNPTHKDIDYALYMRGLVSEDQDSNMFQELFGIDRSDRDPALVQEAFRDYERLIRDYPTSKYAADAAQRMVALKNRLARYEIRVAEYYYEREAYVSAVGRGQYVLEYLSDTPSVEQALEIMIRSYDKIGLQEAKSDTLAVLKLNFPRNELVKN